MPVAPRFAGRHGRRCGEARFDAGVFVEEDNGLHDPVEPVGFGLGNGADAAVPEVDDDVVGGNLHLLASQDHGLLPDDGALRTLSSLRAGPRRTRSRKPAPSRVKVLSTSTGDGPTA